MNGLVSIYVLKGVELTWCDCWKTVEKWAHKTNKSRINGTQLVQRTFHRKRRQNMWIGILIIFFRAPYKWHSVSKDFFDCFTIDTMLFVFFGAVDDAASSNLIPVVDRSIVPINKFYVARVGWRSLKKSKLNFYSNFAADFLYNRRKSIYELLWYFIGLLHFDFITILLLAG